VKANSLFFAVFVGHFLFVSGNSNRSIDNTAFFNQSRNMGNVGLKIILFPFK